MTNVPLDTIDLDGEAFDIEIKFCWIDEDGARISPVHKTVLAALNYLVSWEDNKARIEAQAARAQETNDQELRYIEESIEDGAEKVARRHRQVEHFEHEMGKINEAKLKLTRTGKPPAQLKRLVTSTVIQNVSADELLLVKTTARTHGINLKRNA